MRRFLASTSCLVLSANSSVAGLCEGKTLEHKVDFYDGVNILSSNLPVTKEEFTSRLGTSLARWKEEKKRGVWLKVPTSRERIGFVETAVSKYGFKVHSAEPSEIILNKWLLEGEEEDTLPGNASSYIGVGCLVLNKEGKILAVQERNGYLKDKGWWKIPTGLINQNEHIPSAALRELKEETNIDATFKGVLCFRQLAKGFLGKCDLFFLCVCEAESVEITAQESEIEKAEWLDAKDFFGQEWLYQNSTIAKVNVMCKQYVENPQGSEHLLLSQVDAKPNVSTYGSTSFNE